MTERTEARVEIAVRAAQASALVVQVKHRPRLWLATVDGEAVTTAAALDVWTAVAVPAGSSRVVLQAAVPTVVWGLSAAAVIITALLALVRRAT